MPSVKIELHKAQSDFRHSDATFRGYVGGRGAGKSFVGAYDLIVRAEPGRTYGLYAPTYPMLRDAALAAFLEIARDKLHYVKEFNKGNSTILLGNGAQILCRSLDNPETARGPNLSGAWIDEASLVCRDAFDIVIACLRQGGEQGWLSATFTPKGRQHWTYDVFGRNADNAAIFQSRTADNPFLPELFEHTLRGQYTSAFAEQELEGKFVDLQGTLCKREWFEFVDSVPSSQQIYRAWDLAATAKTTADYTVGARVCKAGGIYYVDDIRRGQIDAGAVERFIRQTAEEDGKKVRIMFEQEPGSSGKILARHLISALAGFVPRAEPSTGDKVTRALPFFAQAEAGNVKIRRAAWNRDWLDELCAFPHGEHDDQVDATALAFAQLTARKSGAIMFG